MGAICIFWYRNFHQIWVLMYGGEYILNDYHYIKALYLEKSADTFFMSNGNFRSGCRIPTKLKEA